MIDTDLAAASAARMVGARLSGNATAPHKETSLFKQMKDMKETRR